MNVLLFDWPFVGLALAIAVLVALFVLPRPGRSPPRLRDPSWLLCLMLPLYMLHQFEEHGVDLLGEHYPFRAWFCAAVGYPDLSSCPGDPAFIFAVNVGAVWIAGISAILFRRRNPLVGASAFSICLLNAVAHVNGAIRQHAYNPGLLTSVLLFIPISLYVFRTLLRERVLDRRGLALVMASGVLLHVILIGGLVADGRGLLPHPLNVALQAANGFVPLLFGMLYAARQPHPTVAAR